MLTVQVGNAMSVLVINAGSSSVKFAMFGLDDLSQTSEGLLTWSGTPKRAEITFTNCGQSTSSGDEVVRKDLGDADYGAGVMAALQLLQSTGPIGFDGCLRAIGHRLIHGGADIARPVRIDGNMKKTISRHAPLAPLHIPAGLEAIEAAETTFPNVDQIGVFDTSFFANIEPEAYHYAVPRDWYESWGVRRFGFHGISHTYCTMRANEMLDRSNDELRIVICHLGQGCSAAAVRGETAVTGTMGMTPLEGLPMGTRSGAIDPGILLHLIRDKGLTIDQLDHALHHESGLLGLSGISSDYREIEQAAERGNARAKLAIQVFGNRVMTAVASLTAALGGLDVLVFTGGIGENSHELRRDVCNRLRFLGIELDTQHNTNCQLDANVAAHGSAVQVLVLHTREDLMIARQCRELIEPTV